jgi:hypothetical protein
MRSNSVPYDFITSRPIRECALRSKNRPANSYPGATVGVKVAGSTLTSIRMYALYGSKNPFPSS